MVGFFDSWPAKRLWPVDMAGFAVSIEYLGQHPNATMPYKAGHEEDGFLRSLQLTLDDIEPKASNCTEVLVWHTQTKKTKQSVIQIGSKPLDLDKSSLHSLLASLESLGVVHLSSTGGKYFRFLAFDRFFY